MKRYIVALVLVTTFSFLIVGRGEVAAAGLPPWPQIYSGYVYVDGVPAPDGSVVVGKVGSHTSQAVTVANGRYAGLTVGAPDSSFFGKMITFHLNDSVVADERDEKFEFNEWIVVNSGFDLNFPAFPTPTPFPTATPTNTPIPSPTPDIPSAMILSGVVEVDVGEPSQLTGKDVIARLGSFFSPAAILDITSVGAFEILVFEDLIVDPRDYKFEGQPISFIVDGVEATGTLPVFEAGGSVDVALRVDLPVIPTPVPDVIPTPLIVPTERPVQASSPSVAPAPSPVVIVVTATPLPVAPAVPTPEQPVASEVIVEEESGGSCNLAAPVSRVTGAANTLMLVSPLLLIAAYRRVKGRGS